MAYATVCLITLRNLLVLNMLRTIRGDLASAGGTIHDELLDASVELESSVQNRFNHFPGDIRESIATSIVKVRELFVIHAQQMQHRRVQVVD